MVSELKLRKQIVQQGIDDKASREAARHKSVSSPTIMNALNMRPKNEEVTEAWAKVLVAKGLAIDLVDDLHFRAAIRLLSLSQLEPVCSMLMHTRLLVCSRIEPV